MKAMAALAAFLLMALAPLYSAGTNAAQAPSPSPSATPVLENQPEDEITQAYRTLTKIGAYEEKKEKIKIFKDKYQEKRVLDITINLLMYNYDNPSFKENDQVMYYDDVIAAELIKILGMNGSPEGFPAILHVALNNRQHRDATVREAWKAMMMIKW